ncbi:MAG: ABC transporter substrate-binding protein, partial [Chloroflexota bacterium]
SMARALLPATKSPVASLYLGPIAGAAAVVAGKATTISGVKVMGTRKLQITLTGPYAYFLGSLTYPTADVLDKKVMAGTAPVSYLNNNCKGNQGAGPFVFVCANGSGRNSFYPSGQSAFFKFKPNPNYYGAKPTVDINAPFIADNETNYRLYQAGSVDTTVVPIADIGHAMTVAGHVKAPELDTDYITPNQKMAPFTNENCRLAIAYAIDRESIGKSLLKGTESPLYDVIPPGMPNGGQGYFGKISGVPYYNPTIAKQYLNKCPGKLQNVTMTYQKTSQDLTHEYDIIRTEISAIGGNITLKPLLFNAWLGIVGQSMQKTKTQITENLWIDDYPDAQDWLSQLLQTGANYDIGGFSNPTYDHLVNLGNVEFNAAKRATDYRKAMMIAVKTGSWIGVGYQSPVWIVSPKLHNLIYTDGNIYPKNGDWSTVSIG